MLAILRERFRQGYRTGKFPAQEPVLPDRFRGLPKVTCDKHGESCAECGSLCPFGAVAVKNGEVTIDLGCCLFCSDCPVQSHGCIEFTGDYRLASRTRLDLLLDRQGPKLAAALDKKMQALFGRSLKLRQVSAGGCNGCEADVNVLGTLVFDMGRFGIQFVASPRHADGILVTGPVTRNMQEALLATYAAVPEPKLVIASGACAIGGGPYRGSTEANDGIGDLLPVDLYIPGCPPHPYTTLDGLLRLLGRR